MTRFVGTPLRGIEFSSVSDEAISARVNGDGHARVRIDAGGRITWSAGTEAGDTTLYRHGENHLKTDDIFEATGGLVTIATDGPPTVALQDGALAIDTTNHVFYFRSNNLWNQVTGGGGGASIEIADAPPAAPSEGDLWYESDTGSMFVYYDSAWIETGGVSTGGATVLDGLEDVVITSPTNGQVLKYDGAQWVNDTDDAGTTINSLDDIGDVAFDVPILESGQSLKYDGTNWVNDFITLGTDTKGDYLYDISAGTGVTVVHSPNEGSTATVSIGQDVSLSASPQFVSLAIDKINFGGTTNPTTIQSLDGSLYLKAALGSGLEVGETASQLNGDLTVTGNLTVSGTTTTINTETLLVEDNIVTLNSSVTGAPTEDSGIEIERGTSDNVSILWNETNDRWEVANSGITSGNEFKVNGIDGNSLRLATNLNGFNNSYFIASSSNVVSQMYTQGGGVDTAAIYMQHTDVLNPSITKVVTVSVGAVASTGFSASHGGGQARLYAGNNSDETFLQLTDSFGTLKIVPSDGVNAGPSIGDTLIHDGTYFRPSPPSYPALEQKVKNQMVYLMCEVGP